MASTHDTRQPDGQAESTTQTLVWTGAALIVLAIFAFFFVF